MGQWLRGTPDEKSDVDLAVVVPDGMTGKQTKSLLSKAIDLLRQKGIPEGEKPGGVTLQEMPEGYLVSREDPPGVYRDIKKQGKDLYVGED